MEMPAKKEMFSYDDDDDNFTVIKEEMEYCYESESKPGSDEYNDSYEGSEPVEECTGTTPIGTLTPHTVSSENKQIQCNRIILGSKPNKISVDHNTFECFAAPYQINVVLADVQSYLQKSKRYCSICSTLFSESRDYLNHYETFHAPKDVPNIFHNKTMVSKSKVYQCNICADNFMSNLLLRTHIEQSHNEHSVNNSNNNQKNEIIRSKQYNSKLNHTCFHCNEAFLTQKSLIEHLYEILQTKTNTADITPVLKSILFKCHKCDINFLSLQVAECHSEHMEMLINWKCSICYRIFKKEDELNHERQHSVSNHFITYNLAEVDVSKILFKCYKCFTHFTENAFLYHFRDCGLESFLPTYCDICEILLDSSLKVVHETDHCYNDFNMKKLTVIETDVISDNPVDAVNELQIRRKVNELEQICSEVKVVLHRLDTNELYTHMKSNIHNYKQFERNLSPVEASMQNYNNEEPEARPECVEAMSPKSDMILKYDESDSLDLIESFSQNSNEAFNSNKESDRNFDSLEITLSESELINNSNKKSDRLLESLEVLSPKSDLVLLYEESSSESFKSVLESDKILNSKRSQTGIKSFGSISPKIIGDLSYNESDSSCAASDIISPEFNDISVNDTEIIVDDERNNSSKLDEIITLSPESLQISAESDYILDNVTSERKLESFEANSAIIEEIIISDESEYEANESESKTPKSKHIRNDKAKMHKGLTRNKSLHSNNEKVDVTSSKNQRKHGLSNVTSSNINRKRAISTPDQVDNFKRPNVAYYYCEPCKCFVTDVQRYLHKQSLCQKATQMACTICGLVFNNRGFSTHKRLHDKSKNLKLNNFTFYNIDNDEPIKPPIPEYPKCNDCKVHFLTKTAKMNHTCTEDAFLTCVKCGIRLSEAAFRVHMAFHSYNTNDPDLKNDGTNPKYVQPVVNLECGSKEKGIQKDISSQKSQPKCDKSNPNDDENASLNNIEIVYTCLNCCVTVDTYDKVVEHSQGHYTTEEKETESKICNICDLKIDKLCYLDHCKVHEQGKAFKVLKFDSYYFPSETKKWIQHVFKNVPKEKVTKILAKSVYRFEGRIKMDIVQLGPPDLTVYKCDKCHCFIDPSSLYKHADNSCFKVRIHPCTFCGLPFISAASRIEHEKVHQRPGIMLKSYRIVLFNREEDKRLNSSFYFRKRYVLYLCRNCGGVIDKLQLENHRCDPSDLKKCPQCRLLLYSKEYDAHIKLHKDFDSFNHTNMKVIFVGEVQSGASTAEKKTRINFPGVINDFIIYRCKKCQLCVRNEKCIRTHSCDFVKQHCKCPKCSLHFSVSRLKTHMRNHERDSFYLLSNMSIISFDPCSHDLNKCTTTEPGHENSVLSDSNTDSDSDIVMNAEEKNVDEESSSSSSSSAVRHPLPDQGWTMGNTVIEEIVKVYKCDCGLHFLNEDSISRHFGVCLSINGASKQKCPKCDLMFSTNILFTHMLAHHSNKNRRYKYDIIEMAKK